MICVQLEHVLFFSFGGDGDVPQVRGASRAWNASAHEMSKVQLDVPHDGLRAAFRRHQRSQRQARGLPCFKLFVRYIFSFLRGPSTIPPSEIAIRAVCRLRLCSLMLGSVMERFRLAAGQLAQKCLRTQGKTLSRAANKGWITRMEEPSHVGLLCR